MAVIKTYEAEGNVLDWLVAKCQQAEVAIFQGGKIMCDTYQDDPPAGINELDNGRWQLYSPSTLCAQGCPIIDREIISILARDNGIEWWATAGNAREEEALGHSGPTRLIAAMRCYVAEKLGDEIEVPDGLLKCLKGC